MQVLLSSIAGISILGTTLFTPTSFLSQYFFDAQQQIAQINVQTLVGNALESTQKIVPILSKKAPSEIFIDFESEYNSSHNSESSPETDGSYIALNTQPTAQAQLLLQQNNFEQPLLKDAEIYVPQNFQTIDDSEEFEQKLLIQKNFFSKQIDRIYDRVKKNTQELNDRVDSVTTTSSGISFATIALGGTGISTVPNYGELLIGDGSGGYTLIATSSLGISSGGSSQWTTSGSDIYYTTGNVGIGTVSPTAPLNVVGRTTLQGQTLIDGTSNTQQLVVKAVAGQSTSVVEFRGSDNVARLSVFDLNVSPRLLFNYGSAAGADVTAQLNSVDQLSFGFNNLGSFGGTPGTASGRLMYFFDRVTGTFRGAIGPNGDLFWGTNYTTGYSVKLGPPTSSAVKLTLQGASGQSANYFEVNSNGASSGNIAVISSAGNLGLGTTSPYAKLSVAGSIVMDSFNATSTATSTIAGGLSVGTATSSGLVTLRSVHSGQPALAVLRNANFSAATPLQTWETSTASRRSWFDGNGLKINTDPTLSNAITIYRVGDDSFGSVATSIGNYSALIDAPTTYPLFLRNTSGGVNQFFLSGGDITTTQGTNIGSLRFAGNADIGYREVARFNVVAETNFGGAGSSKASMVFSTNDDVIPTGIVGGFGTPVYEPRERMRIASNGNIGIASTSPFAMLSIMNGGSFLSQAPSISFAIGSSTMGLATTTHFVVNSLGNVGIGTTSPTALLSLGNGSGSPGTTPALGINFGDSTANLYRLASGMIRTDGALAVGSNLHIYYGNYMFINKAGNGWLNFAARDTTGSEAVFNLSNIGTLTVAGNVGIGTTSPYAKLSVAGDFVSTRLHATSTTATSTIAGNLIVGSQINEGVSVPSNPGITLYGDLSFSGGARTIRGSDDAINSGDVNIQGGYMQFSSTGGSVNISGGQGGSLGLAGNVTLAGGAGSSGMFGASGGTVTIRGGLKPSGPYNSVLLQPSGGNVGIGEASPTYPLHVTATSLTDVARFAGSGGTQCTVVTGTGFSCTSDERFKTNIDALGGSVLESVLNLRPVKFNWKYDPEGPEQIGFIAQELEEVFPEVVRSDSDGYKSVAYAQMTPLLVKAIQEQNTQIKNLSLILTSTDPLPQIFIDRIVTALSQITNLVVKKLTADSVTTKELCVEDVCVTREQFLRIIRETGAEAQQEQNESDNEEDDEEDHRDDNNSEEQVEDENVTEDMGTSDDTNGEGANNDVSSTDAESVSNAEDTSSEVESTDQINNAGDDSLEGDGESDSSINNNGESESQQESNQDSDAANRESESDSTDDSDAESINEDSGDDDSGDGGGDSEGSSPGSDSGESQ